MTQICRGGESFHYYFVVEMGGGIVTSLRQALEVEKGTLYLHEAIVVGGDWLLERG